MFGANLWKIFDNTTKNDNYFSRNYKIDTFLLQIITLAAKNTDIFCRFQYWVILKSCFILPSSTGVVSSRRSSSGVMCVAGLKSAEPI